MYSINRLFFLSLGSVCFLIVPFFWLALALDFSALENFVVKLSTTEFVGYPIPELLGAQKGATVIDQVLRIKFFFTVLVVAYSLFFVALSRVEESRKRNNYCARGLAVPLFILILGFWFKFIGDDHIISKEEKTELFQYTTGCFIISVMMLTYSFRSVKKIKPQKEEVTETPKTSSTEKKETESGQGLVAKEDNEKASPEEESVDGESEASGSETEALPAPDALDPVDDLAVPEAEPAVAEPDASVAESEELPPPDVLDPGEDLASGEEDPAVAEPDESVAESEALPPPDALDPREDLASPEVEPADAEPEASGSETEALPAPDALDPSDDLAVPEVDPAVAEPDESVAESEALPPPDALDPGDEPPPLPSVDAPSDDDAAQSQDGGLANNEFIENLGSESPPLTPTDSEPPSS